MFRNLIVGLSFSGLFHLLLKKLKLVSQRDVFTKTSSLDLHIDDSSTDEKNRQIKEHEVDVSVFDDMLDYNQKALDRFFTIPHIKDSGFRDIIQSQSYFVLSKEQHDTTTINLFQKNRLQKIWKKS